MTEHQYRRLLVLPVAMAQVLIFNFYDQKYEMSNELMDDTRTFKRLWRRKALLPLFDRFRSNVTVSRSDCVSVIVSVNVRRNLTLDPEASSKNLLVSLNRR